MRRDDKKTLHCSQREDERDYIILYYDERREQTRQDKAREDKTRQEVHTVT
jgi:hypothetical protein